MSEIKVNSVVNSTGDNDSGLDLSTNDNIKFKIANVEKAVIDANGNLGIGESSPSNLLHVKVSDVGVAPHASAQIALERSGTNYLQFLTANNGTSGILFGDGDDADVTQIKYDHSSSSMQFVTETAERMRIDSSGNVLVGKTSQGIGNSGVELREGSASGFTRDNVALDVNRTGTSGTIMRFRFDGTTEGAVSVAGDILKIFGTKSTANCGIGFFSNNTIRPVGNNGAEADNEVDLGHSSTRFDDVRATNGTIQTSDENEKQDIASATAKELNVAKKLSALFKTFRWKDKVAQKGDKARTHTGIVAQEVQTAFKAEGLDASNYGLFTSDTWWEKEIKVDAVKADEEKGIEAEDAYTYIDTKDEKTDGYTERTRLGVRYPELFSFIFSSIEARLTALESK